MVKTYFDFWSKLTSFRSLGTPENERIFSTLKRVVTDKRTSLTASNTETLVLISHETRRMHPDSREFILKRVPEIAKLVEIKCKIANERVRVAMAKGRAEKRKQKRLSDNSSSSSQRKKSQKSAQ